MAQCTATSKTSNKQCTKLAIAGGTVCRFHGGAAPQVIAAAKLRLAELIDPSIGVLARLVKKKGKLTGLQFAAARDVLDRCGLTEPTKLEHSGTLLELLDNIRHGSKG